MKVRAFIDINTNGKYEMVYPDSDSPEDLSVFYGVIRGYEQKGIFYKLDYAGDLVDKDGTFLFENDIVEVFGLEDGPAKVLARVKFDTGCFVIDGMYDSEGFYGTLDTFKEDDKEAADDEVSVLKVGTVYEEPYLDLGSVRDFLRR